MARLYPKTWRERYGAEFGALLEDVPPNWRTSANMLKGALAMQLRTWNFRRIFLAAELAGLLAATGILLAIPRQYASEAVLRVRSANGAEIGDALLDVSTQVLSQRSLSMIADSEALYPRDRSRMPIEDVIERMRRKLEITPIRSSNLALSAFSIKFTYEDPQKAQRVVNDLAYRFIDGNARGGSDLSLRILDAASLEKSPVSPDRTMIIAWGAVGGLALGLILALRLRGSRRTA